MNLERTQHSEESQQPLAITPRHRIKLLTYNLFLRPPGIKTNADDFKDERFHNIKQVMLNYDIVCFQELFITGNFRKEAIIEYGIRNKFHYWAMSEAPQFHEGSPVDGGLCVLSRYPIKHSVFKTYGVGVLSDSASDKGSLYCSIQLENNTLHLFNTHLQATYHTFDDHLEKKLTIITRLHQFEILARRIEETLNNEGFKTGDLVLVAGDLNTDARKTYYDFPFNEAPEFTKKYQIDPSEFNEYSIMKEILKNKGKNTIKDLAFERYESHPVTFGNGSQNVLTGAYDVDSKQRLDYIIQIIPDNKPSFIKPQVDSCLVEEFPIKNETYTQLSDHYGMSIDLCF